MGVAGVRFFGRLTALALFLELSTPVPAQLHPTAIDAHRAGAPVTTIIEFGEQYLGSELYDAKITVVEVVRGEKAWDIVRRANASNLPPKTGFEYVLARIRFQFSARTQPANDTYNIDPSQFAATDSTGAELAAATVAEPPEPILKGALKAGDWIEGWVVFLVPRNISKPLMIFREDVGTVSHRGGGTWFQLYSSSATSASAKP